MVLLKLSLITPDLFFGNTHACTVCAHKGQKLTFHGALHRGQAHREFGAAIKLQALRLGGRSPVQGIC